MRALLTLVGVVLTVGCSEQNLATPAVSSWETALSSDLRRSDDLIDQLVARLSATHGLWMNGAAPVIQLPETASPDQVLEQVFESTGFDTGRVKSFHILRVRSVQIDGGAYWAALVQTDLGEKIVLFTAGGRWSRVYDAKTGA